MKTVTENLTEKSAEIQTMLQELLVKHSVIYRWDTPTDGFNRITSSPYAWRDLGNEGHQFQSKLLKEYQLFSSILNVLMNAQPSDTIRTLDETHKTILHSIEQNTATHLRNTPEALTEVTEALSTQLGLLSRLYDPSKGESIFIPDTNALLENTELESWSFDNVDKFTIILTPTVLSELDKLKINHRSDTVREKAQKLIRQIKEYRRRGTITEGVPLINGKSTITAIATEPNMDKSLPWLDPTNNDDHFLATVIEIMRSRPRSPVILVSNDINMQNKAEFARIPFIETPSK